MVNLRSLTGKVSYDVEQTFRDMDRALDTLAARPMPDAAPDAMPAVAALESRLQQVAQSLARLQATVDAYIASHP